MINRLNDLTLGELTILPDYLTRMIRELSDLDLKLNNLEKVISGETKLDIDKTQWNSLIEQREAMTKYANVLEVRIVYDVNKFFNNKEKVH